MATELLTISGEIAKVGDRTVGADRVSTPENATTTTQYFNEIEIDLSGSTASLALLARWPNRLFLQLGDRVVAAGCYEQDRFQVLALCNLTDNSNYFFCGSPLQRRKLRRMLAPHLPGDSGAHWISAG